MATTFQELIKSRSLAANLPFDIDFEVRGDFGQYPVENVAGFQIPVINALLSQEDWFFNELAAAYGNRANEYYSKLRKLTRDFRDALGISEIINEDGTKLTALEVASELLNNPSEEIKDDPRYEAFEVANEQRVVELAEIARTLISPIVTDWIRVTFFLKSRVSPSIELGDVSTLTKEKLQALVKFITREINEGVDPELPTEAEEQTSEELGKSQKTSGKALTGK